MTHLLLSTLIARSLHAWLSWSVTLKPIIICLASSTRTAFKVDSAPLPLGRIGCARSRAGGWARSPADQGPLPVTVHSGAVRCGAVPKTGRQRDRCRAECLQSNGKGREGTNDRQMELVVVRGWRELNCRPIDGARGRRVVNCLWESSSRRLGLKLLHRLVITGKHNSLHSTPLHIHHLGIT